MAPRPVRLAVSLALVSAVLLAAAPSASLAQPAALSAGDREVNFLLTYLNRNGFSSLATRIRGSGMQQSSPYLCFCKSNVVEHL